MRKILSLGCCAVYLAFGFIAGGAHVHEAADHHEEMRGLHLDHDHLGDFPAHHSTDHDTSAPTQGDARGIDARHSGHHEGDALYLTVTVRSPLDTGSRLAPTMVVVDAAIDPPAFASMHREELPNPLRGPPSEGRTPSRAPPA